MRNTRYDWGVSRLLGSFAPMLLAELEIWHSRPIAPTRRIALGHMVLPVDPAPGYGGILLGAVVASHVGAVDEEMLVDVHRLLGEVERAERVPQPRLRHRFQIDRHGLALSTHRLVDDGGDDGVSFDIASTGTALQHVLGAVYAIERLHPETRVQLVPLMRRAITWRGPLGTAFVRHLAGRGAGGGTLQSITDPRAWALDVLGFPGGTVRYSKGDVISRYRRKMREAHPDHGGDSAVASREMVEISAARRVLLDAL